MGSVIWIPVFLISATLLLYAIAMNIPTIPDGNMDALKFPSNLEDLSALSSLLSSYKRDHMLHVLTLFCSAYIFKQTFAIPGSVFMNLLAGALFGPWVAFPLTCTLSATGASCCYLLSKYFGRHHVIKIFPDKIKSVEEKIKENRDSLLFFLLFLRFFPMSPNWFMNMAAPIVGVPLHLFFISVFIGLMPYNYICIQTGCMLSTVSSMDEVFTMSTTLKLAAIAAAAAVPGVVIKKLKQRKDHSVTIDKAHKNS